MFVWGDVRKLCFSSRNLGTKVWTEKIGMAMEWYEYLCAGHDPGGEVHSCRWPRMLTMWGFIASEDHTSLDGSTKPNSPGDMVDGARGGKALKQRYNLSQQLLHCTYLERAARPQVGVRLPLDSPAAAMSIFSWRPSEIQKKKVLICFCYFAFPSIHPSHVYWFFTLCFDSLDKKQNSWIFNS